jgi:hypothetical protein
MADQRGDSMHIGSPARIHRLAVDRPRTDEHRATVVTPRDVMRGREAGLEDTPLSDEFLVLAIDGATGLRSNDEEC